MKNAETISRTGQTRDKNIKNTTGKIFKSAFCSTWKTLKFLIKGNTCILEQPKEE